MKLEKWPNIIRCEYATELIPKSKKLMFNSNGDGDFWSLSFLKVLTKPDITVLDIKLAQDIISRFSVLTGSKIMNTGRYSSVFSKFRKPEVVLDFKMEPHVDVYLLNVIPVRKIWILEGICTFSFSFSKFDQCWELAASFGALEPYYSSKNSLTLTILGSLLQL